MNLRDEVEKIKQQGYTEGIAEARLCQDIILMAIAESGMAKNTTIKGGVVMQSLSKNIRRATEDLDLDFIRYSISDESIRTFVEKLNCIDGISISIIGKITELNQQDYKGKRIKIKVSDTFDTVLTLKMDIGVHNDLSVEQEEYAFDVGFQRGMVSLLVNTKAQMIAEKLKSLVRFGSRSTRYKDIFDIYFLRDGVDINMLKQCINSHILDDNTLKYVNTMDDIIRRLRSVFGNKGYIKEIETSNKNWINLPLESVLKEDLDFFIGLSE